MLDRPRLERLAERIKDSRFRDVQIDVVPAASGITMYAPNLRDRFGSALSWTMAAVGVLLVIACVNVASLLLARGAARQREMAIRVALGAGRLRLFRQLLAESLLLATCGGVLGVLLAYRAAGALARFLASGRAPVGVPEGLQIAVPVDLRVLLFAAGAATATGVLVGLAPAWHAFLSSPARSLRAVGAASATRSERRFGQGLVVAQVGLSVVLLSAAALFVRYLSELRTVGVGFEAQSVLQVKLDPSRSGRKPEELAPLYRELVYGLLSHTVERRTSEIGIRIALGATSRNIVFMVGAGALPLVLGGFAVGAPLALVAKVHAGKVLALVAATQAEAPIALPAGVAWPIVVAAVAMIAVALIASCIPARRAARVDPIEALRFE